MTPHHEHEFEAAPGLPEPLPAALAALLAEIDAATA